MNKTKLTKAQWDALNSLDYKIYFACLNRKKGKRALITPSDAELEILSLVIKNFRESLSFNDTDIEVEE